MTVIYHTTDDKRCSKIKRFAGVTTLTVCKRWRRISTKGWPELKEWHVSEFGVQNDEHSTHDDEILTLRECFVALQRCGPYLTKASFTLGAILGEIPNMVNNACDRLEEITIWLPSKSHEPELIKDFLKKMDDIFEGQRTIKQAVIYAEKPHSNGFIHHIVRKSPGNRERKNCRFSRQSKSLSSRIRSIMDLISFSNNFHLE
ncbi:uncharacterized protein LOC107035837 isoform X2 [Diachasma alloeum]|uniref:uncharacterized protein LOC107035837 isoform X2 n=1 Tax=Diachasma alloeum TaxID=454923 RepID=UPI0007384741|nr:uncharacterized protein LOC107035837 isoform X2 [Diachasma alloeum]